MSNVFYGWFDDAGQTTPTSDIPDDGPCLFCGRPITATDVRSYAIMPVKDYARRSYFYRTHRTCAVKWPDKSMDEFIFDMIDRNGD